MVRIIQFVVGRSWRSTRMRGFFAPLRMTTSYFRKNFLLAAIFKGSGFVEDHGVEAVADEEACVLI